MENILSIENIEESCPESVSSKAVTAIQQDALKLTNCDKRSLDFKTDIQMAFLNAGADIETSLAAKYSLQKEALDSNVTPEMAIKFVTDLQIDCLQLGLEPKYAINCKTDDEYACLSSVAHNVVVTAEGDQANIFDQQIIAGCLPNLTLV